MSRLLGEPLLHFVLIGAALFLLYSSRNGAAIGSDATAVIEITPELSASIAGQFRSTWQRDPTPQERAGLIDDYIREEVLYRDALALGLDRDDAVIRQRMRLKMEMLSEGMAAKLTPDDATLAAWFAPRAQEFAAPPQVTFEQVELGATDDAAVVLARLAAGADPAGLRRGSLLPRGLEAATPQVVDGEFGRGFYDSLAALPDGRWSGPVKSPYGSHLVRILERIPAPQVSLAAVRPKVLDAWRREQVQALRQQQFDALVARYRIVRSDDADQ